MVKLPARPAGSRAASRGRKPLATVHRTDLWGLRKHKYDWLNHHNATNTEWTVFVPDPPDFFFHPRNAQHEQEWNEAWSIRRAFVLSGNGVKTERDHVSIHFTRKEVEQVIADFRRLDEREIRWKYGLGKDSRDWSVARAKADVTAHSASKPFSAILYRPFDVRHTWYSGAAKGFIGTPAAALMRHLLAGENLGLVTTRQTKEEFGVLATTVIAGHKSCAAYDINTVFPLYLYPDGEEAAQAELVPVENGRRPNLAAAFVAAFASRLKLKFVPDGRGDLKKTFGPEDVFHYLYAIFHAPGYRGRYAAFLKLDFPRVPVTSQPALFRKLCARGARLVGLHTLKLASEEDVAFDVPGPNVVEHVVYVPPRAAMASPRRGQKPASSEAPAPPPVPRGYEAGPAGRVYINRAQFFDGVAPVVWQFHIGGYQVAQKWLKDRLGRTLTHDDIQHYQRTLAALAETRVEMAHIDSLINDHGGWPLQ